MLRFVACYSCRGASGVGCLTYLCACPFMIVYEIHAMLIAWSHVYGHMCHTCMLATCLKFTMFYALLLLSTACCESTLFTAYGFHRYLMNMHEYIEPGHM